jgi:hypothetical protein
MKLKAIFHFSIVENTTVREKPTERMLLKRNTEATRKIIEGTVLRKISRAMN